MGSCLPLFHQILFSIPCSFSSTFGIPVIQIIHLWHYPTGSSGSAQFSPSCLDLVISIDLSSGYLFFSFVSFILLLSPSTEFFILDIVFNSYKISIWYISISLLRPSVFPFVSRVSILSSWIIFIIAASDNSNNCHLSVGICWLSFSTELRFSWFFVCQVILDYIMNIWLLCLRLWSYINSGNLF